MSTSLQNLLPYSPAVEQPEPNEQQIFQELSDTMGHITRTMADRYRHAYRPVHAKSHGVVKATLQVLPGLPPELAQGIFAKPASYGVLMRFSTNPGDMLADNVSSPRGLALKVLGVQGEPLDGSTAGVQDFVCIDTDTFPVPNPEGFLKQMKTFDKNLTVPEGVKHAISTTARLASEALQVVHVHSPTLAGIGFPAINILGETFTTVAPLRFGDYVAKIAFVPSSESLTSLTGKHIDLGEGYNPLRDLIQAFFRGKTAVWEVKAQLALNDTEHFPIEKADVTWPVEQSPWQTVATLTATPQDSYSDARQTYVDERIVFTPFQTLAAHQPLGGIMRSRKQAYLEAQKYRAQRNAREIQHPASLNEIPD